MEKTGNPTFSTNISIGERFLSNGSNNNYTIFIIKIIILLNAHGNSILDFHLPLQCGLHMVSVLTSFIFHYRLECSRLNHDNVH